MAEIKEWSRAERLALVATVIAAVQTALTAITLIVLVKGRCFSASFFFF